MDSKELKISYHTKLHLIYNMPNATTMLLPAVGVRLVD